MKFSVIVPTYNRRKLLEGCINSILEQDYPKRDYEVIVVDDGSTDDTAPYLNSLKRIRYMKTDRKGAGGARNAGLAAATGKYIAFTDDDCVVPRDWLQRFETELKKGADAVGGSIMNPTDTYIAWAQYYLNFSAWMPELGFRHAYDIPTANICYRKNSIWNNRFPELTDGVYEDSIFNMLLLQQGGKIHYVPEIAVSHKTWEDKQGITKFFRIQRKSAIGFVKGGYKVHNKIGKFLYDVTLLNLLCPRLSYVALRCLGTRHWARFIISLPLVLAGEFYKGLVIVSNRNPIRS